MKNSALLNVILRRNSLRNFDKNRKIPRKILGKILLAGIRAPSAGNIQPRTLITINDDTVKNQLYQLCEDQAFMQDAPVWFVVCLDLHRHLKAAKLTGVDYDFTGVLPYTFGVLDAALSLENMVIAAESLGLGSVIVGSVIEHPAKVKEILKLPQHCLALSILCIGYPKKKSKRTKKWSRNVMVCKDFYRDINARDVSAYWKEVIDTDLKKCGKEISREEIGRIRKKGYGEAYSNHYRESFVKATNKKLMRFLQEQAFLKPDDK
jgi:nitroreductase